MPRKAVAKKQDYQAPALASQFEENADQGFEEADRDSYAIPFLAILQSNSPQCKKSEGEYIEGAQEGNFYNTVSAEVVDPDKTDCFLIPCHYTRSFVEWKPREAGGGFVAQYSVDDGLELLKQATRDDNNKDMLPNGNYLVDTRSHFCLLVAGDAEPEPVVCSFASTQMKKSRKWMTVMDKIRMRRADGSSFKPPMFAYRYHVKTVPESNDKGAWMGWKIEKDAIVEDRFLFEQAKAFRDAVVSGEAKAQEPTDGSVVEDSEEF